MLHLNIFNRYTQVEDANEEQLNLIQEWCSKEYNYYGMDFTIRPPSRKRQVAYINYFTGFNKFPAGWTGTFAQRLSDFGHELKITDHREIPNKQFSDIIYKGPALRNYQVEAANLAMQRGRGIIHHATGSGKTVLMAYILGTMKMPALIIVPDLNLLDQTAEEFRKFLDKDLVGTIGEGIFEPNVFTVGTIQTIWSRVKQNDSATSKIFQRCEMFMLDEAHHINIAGKNKINNTYFQITQLMDVYYRFGFTATPGDPDDLERELLEATTGRVVHHTSSSYLIKEGFLTQPTIQFYEIKILQRYSDWQTAYKENILKNTERNARIVNLANKFAKEGKSVLITVTRIQEHGVVLHELIDDSMLMIGQTSTADRQDMFDDFKSKRSKILISTVVNEGVNIPSMDVIIMAGGGKSKKGVIQKAGRALRKSTGKRKAHIIDFYDNDSGMLLRHSKSRLKAYKEETEFIINDIVKAEDKEDWTKNL